METINVKAKIENIEKVTTWVNQLLFEHNCLDKIIMHIDVAIDEIYSNICFYAYDKNSIGQIEIGIDFYDDNVKLVFKDDGVKYNPLEKDDPDVTLSLEDREIGGLGIYLVKKRMDSIEYQYIDKQNVLTLTKKIK